MVLRKSLPEILKLKSCGRSSDLFLQRCLPIINDSGQDNHWNIIEITATGTVPDSHRIPYYQLPLKQAATPQLKCKGIKKREETTVSSLFLCLWILQAKHRFYNTKKYVCQYTCYYNIETLRYKECKERVSVLT